MPVTITLTDGFNRESVIFPSQISRFYAITEVRTNPNIRSYIQIGPHLGTYTSSIPDLVAATTGLCIPLTFVSYDGVRMADQPRVEYIATRTIIALSATTPNMRLFGTPGFNTRVELIDESDPSRTEYYLYVSETVDELRSRYESILTEDIGYVRSLRICDGPRMTGDVTIPCHVTGISIGNEPTIRTGVVNIPQSSPGVHSIQLGNGLRQDGQVVIPVGSTSADATLISGTELASIRTNITTPQVAGVSSLQVGSGTQYRTGAVSIPSFSGTDDASGLDENGFFLMGKRAILKLVNLIKRIQVPYSVTLDPATQASSLWPEAANVINYVSETVQNSGVYNFGRIMNHETSPVVVNFSPAASGLSINCPSTSKFIAISNPTVETSTLAIPDGTKSIRVIPFRKTDANWPAVTPSGFFAYVEIIA